MSDYFAFLNKYDPAQIAALLEAEKVQTVSVVLGCLPPGKSAEILKKLNEKLRNDVVKRIATSGQVSETVIAAMERALRKNLKNVPPAIIPGS